MKMMPVGAERKSRFCGDAGCYVIRFIGRYKRAFGRYCRPGILYKG